MKIISWNIAGAHLFRGDIQDSTNYEEENLDYIIFHLKNSAADFAGLQESHTPIDGGDKSQAFIIGSELNYRYIDNHPYGKSHIKEGNLLSLSNLSKLPIIKSYFHLVPNPHIQIVRPNGDNWVSFDVGFLVSEIKYNDKLVNIVNCHLVPFQYFNRDLAEPDFKLIRDDIQNFLLSLLDKPSIILGDFNYDKLKNIMPDIFIDNNYKEAFENVETAPGKDQQDHILYSHHFKLKNYSITKLNTDHHLCQAEFIIS